MDDRAAHFSSSFVAATTPQGPNGPALPVLEPGLVSSGSVTIEPAIGTAGEWGTCTVTYVVGAEPVQQHGGIRVQLPEAWHAGIRNSAFRMQGSYPREPNFVTARCSNPQADVVAIVELESDVAFDKTSRISNLNNRAGYYDYVTRAVVRRGALGSGDTLSLVFGDTSGGSHGFRAGVVRVHSAPILLAVDSEGLGRFHLHADRPTLTLEAGEPSELVVTAPSDAVVGEPLTLKVALLDAYANPAEGFRGDVLVSVLEGKSEVPAVGTVTEGTGWLELTCVPRAAGLLRMQAIEPNLALVGVGNPTRVHASMPATRVFWGDLHSHTNVGGDGVGSGGDAYSYARHVSGLDFYGRADHSDYFEAGDPIADFGEYTALAERWNDPDRFVTIHAYEASFGSPYGHHNVYFRGLPGPVVRPNSARLPELWKALDGAAALTIPHHTMKMPAVVDWSDGDDPALRRNFEIFSAHGLSEEFDPYHPLAVEQSLFTNPSSTSRRGTSAQQAWESGMALSTIASSDDHRAHPGMPHQGVVAVRAGALTREAVFDALHDRQTYATTGVRILLDFMVAGIPMGGRGRVAGGVSVSCSAVGTDVISVVEVLRHQRGVPGFAVIATLRPHADRFEWAFSDDPPPGEAIYYVRLRQRGLVRGVPVMAWSSPVWIEVA